MTWRDPTPRTEARLLLRTANAWLEQNAPGHRISNLSRYYEVDEAGAVVKFYEEYSYSYEDDLYSWGYAVIHDRLWEFKLTHGLDGHALKVDAVISDLELAELPAAMVIAV
jgi:hypothetical protein